MDEAKKVEIICFVAGRSGGHIIPALTLAQKTDNKTVFFSTNTKLDYNILKDNPVITKYVPLALGNIPNSIFNFPIFVVQLLFAFAKSLWILLRNRPQKIISMGGYISVPVCLVGWLLQIPITLWELNVVPGRATTFLAPFATTINICFSETQNYLQKYNCKPSEYPIKYSPQAKLITKQEARKKLNLNRNKKTIFVLGGSQGSVTLNKIIPEWIKKNPQKKDSIQIIHQTGTNDSIDWELWYTKNNIPALVFPFCDNLALYYRAADLIVCRSGSGTLHEVVWFNIPCITIPLTTKTTGHQEYNAKAIAQKYPNVVYCNPNSVHKIVTTYLKRNTSEANSTADFYQSTIFQR